MAGHAIREQQVGVITHYWTHLGVAGVHLTGPLEVGERIHVVGHTSDFEQDVASIQIEHDKVVRAEAGADIGLEVVEHAREHDKVFKLVETGDVVVD
ncbi:MAG: translation elongation factor-like protein [Coriobacteriia bacterium]|nr:translation elongation factor-like protein [Coriobacteriia bacterium]